MARKNKRPKKNKGLYNNVGKDLGKAKEVANEFLPIQELPGIDASRPAETSNFLNSLQALADPTFASYAGARNPEMTAYLNRLNESTAGYDSQELNALREQRRRELERGFQSGRASLASGQNRDRVGGVSRSAQLMELAKDYGAQSAAAENDLFVKGADEKQKRLESYGNALSGELENEFNRGNLAQQTYGQQLQNAQQLELDKQKVNLGQAAANQATQSAGILGIMGIGESRRNARRQNRLMRQMNRRTGRGPSSGSGGNQAYADQLNQIAEDVAGGKYY